MRSTLGVHVVEGRYVGAFRRGLFGSQVDV